MVDCASVRLVAPPLYEMEVDSLLRRSVYAKIMTVVDAQTALALLNTLPIEIIREPVINGLELPLRAGDS